MPQTPIELAVDWGDGSDPTTDEVTPDAAGAWTWTGSHHYDTAGSYRIVVHPSAGPDGSATFAAEDAGDTPAAPVVTLTPAAPSGVVGEPVTVTSKMTNQTGTSTGCTGSLAYTKTGITAGDLTVTRDGTPVTLTKTGDTLAGTYGDAGFVVGPGFDASVDFELTYTGPAGALAATHEVLDADGSPLVTKAFTVTLAASRAADAPADADSGASSGDGFSPGAHTVADVQSYVDGHPDEAAAVRAAEQSGKARSTLLAWLDENYPS